MAEAEGFEPSALFRVHRLAGESFKPLGHASVNQKIGCGGRDRDGLTGRGSSAELHHINLVPESGFEPESRPHLGLTGYKPVALPLSYSGKNFIKEETTHEFRRWYTHKKTANDLASPIATHTVSIHCHTYYIFHHSIFEELLL